MSQQIREPAVSGLFYPASKHELIELIELIDKKEREKVNTHYNHYPVIGAIVPHAGYIYSGYQSVHYFKLLSKSQQPVDTFVIINPNHRGIGPGIALDKHTIWKTPLGQIPVDIDFCDQLNLPVSSQAHDHEHSGEVMIPFLQYYMDSQAKIAPISMFDQSYEAARSLAGKITKSVAETGRRIQIIASSDFSHFVSPGEGHRNDNLVCDMIEKFDSKGVYEVINKNNISVCGYGPIMTLIEFSKNNYKSPANKILTRGHSGETAPSTKVVNYITILFYDNQ